MKRPFFILLCLLMWQTLSAQKVGLVLSGGGAKGLTHIGVIKALEENNIPIDCVAGTSMGAIVGSMYAMGMTTDEIITLVKSKDFRYWQTGEIEPENLYYFRHPDAKPDIITLNFRIKKGDSTVVQSRILPTNLMSPRQMNYAFVPLYAPATASCQGNFDKLMVPFRCVAADIYKKEAVIFNQGDLGDAVRASMSFPFMFRPVMIDGNLLFDGGIYNNMPVNVAQDDFKADYVIGSNVGENASKPDPNNILDQIEQMIIKRAEYPIDKGILLDFKLSGISLWDFTIVDQLVQLGYDSTMAHIDEIKKAVARRTTQAEMEEHRQQFRSTMPEMLFQDVIFENLTEPQQLYIERNFHREGETFTVEEFRNGYFRLISDNVFKEIIPHAIYDPTTGKFNLLLNVETENQLKVLVGGNISTSTPNQSYVGLAYQNLSDYAQSAWLDIHFGKTYNGINIGTRIDVPYNLYLKPEICLHRFDYYNGDKIFFNNDRTSYFIQNELYAKFSIGLPMTMKSRAEIGLGYGFLYDSYIQDLQMALEYQEYDRSQFSVLNVYGRGESSTLNDKMYPTAGRHWMWSTQMLYGSESFKSTMFPNQNDKLDNNLWFQFKGEYEDYFNLARYFTLGVQASVSISTRRLLNNYTATLIQAPKFAPTPHSRIVFNEGFCANQYMAYGIKPICTINDRLQVRTEAYIFMPYKTINRKSDNTAFYSDKIFNTPRFLAEASVIYNFKLASAALYVNYYSVPKNEWNVGLNIGFLLFKEKFIE